MVPSAFSVLAAYPFFVNPNVANARKLFFASLIALPAFCSLLVLQRADNPTIAEYYTGRVTSVVTSSTAHIAQSLRASVGSILTSLSSSVQK
jgi:hypothetical protein